MQHSVAIVRCPDYEPNRIAMAIDSLLRALAINRPTLKAGATVLIKPNLLTDARPDQAKTTHPEVVRALIRIMQREGATVGVGDSPARATTIDRVWETTGYRELCDQEHAVPFRFEEHPTEPLACGPSSLQVAAPVLQADLVINVPKVKTHILTTFTGAVKNLYGALPGYQKTMLHREYPTPTDFGRLPAALYRRIRPGLNVADAIIAMQGAGPSGGDPIPLGFLAASTDAVALDTALCAVLGIDPEKLPWSRYLPEDCRTALNPEALNYPMLTPDAVRPRAFRVPASLWPRLIPGWFIRHTQSLAWIRPHFETSCIRCGRCVKACCNDALRLDSDDPLPVLTPARCVACCCCHEVCPQKAVTMRQSPLLNLIRRGKQP